MGSDLLIVLSDPADTVDREALNSFEDADVAANLELPGFVSGRRYALRGIRIRGNEYPARYRFASVYEVDQPRQALLEGMRAQRAASARPAWRKDVAVSTQMCAWLDGGPDLTTRDQLFFLFSILPKGWSFEDYSEWYREHIQENIRASALLREGWRFQLTHVREVDGTGPEHFAVYALDGPAEEMLADTNRAVESGATGRVMEGFHSTAKFEAIALGKRQLAGRSRRGELT